MNIDEKIKQELQQNTQDFEDITVDKDGLFDLVFGSFKGGMRRWIIVVNIVIMIVTAVMLWTGYRFFTATVLQEIIFWGVCVLMAVFAQVGLKQWLFMEMNRSSLMREIKRVEVAVARLSAKLKD